MENMLAVVVGEESKAYEACRILKQLDEEGDIQIYAEAVIGKNADGSVDVKRSEQEFPLHAVAGTAIGALIGILGGPVGFGIGATTGGLAGSIRDFFAAEVSAEFVDELAAALAPGKFAVIADVNEEWVAPVDTRLEALGGLVLRTPRVNFEEEHRARAIASLRAQIAQFEAEIAQESSDRRAKLHAAVDKLKETLQTSLDRATRRMDETGSETDRKVRTLQRKAKTAQPDLRTRLEHRVQRMRYEYRQSRAKLHRLLTGD